MGSFSYPQAEHIHVFAGNVSIVFDGDIFGVSCGGDCGFCSFGGIFIDVVAVCGGDVCVVFDGDIFCVSCGGDCGFC